MGAVLPDIADPHPLESKVCPLTGENPTLIRQLIREYNGAYDNLVYLGHRLLEQTEAVRWEMYYMRNRNVVMYISENRHNFYQDKEMLSGRCCSPKGSYYSESKADLPECYAFAAVVRLKYWTEEDLKKFSQKDLNGTNSTVRDGLLRAGILVGQ